jgi:hypothetical protein
VDSRRVRLQLRVIETVMHAARAADRKAMQQRASEILDAIALEVESTGDAELAALVEDTRADVERPPG